MAKLNLIETIQTKLSTLTKKDGQLIVIRDNASLYVDLDGARIYISDWIDVSTDEERLAMLTPLSNKYYYVVETNKIWRYISGSWLLVTKDNFVDANRKIAGIDLKDDITVDELISALGVDKKVDKVDGMGLSSNDYSDEEKATVAQNKADITELLNSQDITNTTSTTMDNSYDGYVRINKIGGNTEQNTTSGKNQLDCSGLKTTTTNGITFTPVYAGNGELEYINVNGTATGTANYHFPTIKYSANQKYVLNGCPSGGSALTYKIKATADSKYMDIGSGVTFTITEDVEDTVSIVIYSGAVCNNLKFCPMIRLASITDATYEPFTNGASPNTNYPQEPKSVVLSEIRTCKKNLFPINEYSGQGFLIGNNAIHYKLTLDGNFTFSLNKSGEGAMALYICDANEEVIKSFSIPSSESGYITKKFEVFGGRSIYAYSNNATNVLSNMQLEHGDATDFEPYTESVVTLSKPITLNGLNGVQDYVDSKRGVKREECYVKVFRGTETLAGWSTTTGGGILFGYTDSHIANNQGTGLTGSFCNYLTETTSGQNWNLASLGFSINQSGTPLRFRLPEGITTIAEAQAWMAEKYAEGNPLTFIVPRKDIIETPLPDADVEALKSLKSYDGVTHILTDSEVEPDLDMDYGTSKVGAVALQACAEGCIALNRTSDYVEMTDSDIEAIYNEVF